MGYALQVEVTLQTHTCGGCGVTFAVPDDMHRRFRETGQSMRCPNPGCPWPSFHLTETEIAKLERKLASERKAREWAEEARERERRQHIATKGQLTKARKRIGNGVCPCCKRSFQNLRRHMKTKHPDFCDS